MLKLVGILCWGVLIVVGTLIAEELFRDVPLWALVGAAAILASIAIPTMYGREMRRWREARTTPLVSEDVKQAALEAFKTHGQAMTIFVLALILIYVVIEPKIRDWAEKQEETRETSNQRLRTQPTCDSNCENFEWVVETCTREVVKIGRLLGGPLGNNAEKATKHFRGCLVNKGLGWKPCTKGKPECHRLRYIGLLPLTAELPSFVE